MLKPRLLEPAYDLLAEHNYIGVLGHVAWNILEAPTLSRVLEHVENIRRVYDLDHALTADLYHSLKRDVGQLAQVRLPPDEFQQVAAVLAQLP